jgi:hypothetical protein
MRISVMGAYQSDRVGIAGSNVASFRPMSSARSEIAPSLVPRQGATVRRLSRERQKEEDFLRKPVFAKWRMGRTGLAALVLMATTSAAMADDVSPPPAGAPHLPEGGGPIAPLRRGADGSIEVIGPAAGPNGGPARCDEGALCVGKGERFATLAAALAAAHEGALIEVVGGRYPESLVLARRNLVLRGIGGRPQIDCAGLALAGGRACLVLAAPGITLDNLEISGAAPPAAGGMAACIANAPDTDFQVSRIVCHGAETGILATGGTFTIADSEFYDNGWRGNGANLVLAGACRATIRGTTLRDARAGDELLSRCPNLEITDSTLVGSGAGAVLDLPQGGDALVYRSTLEQKQGATGDIVRFAADSCRSPGSLVLKDVTIANAVTDAALRNLDHCRDGAIVLENVTLSGMPLRRYGYIVQR